MQPGKDKVQTELDGQKYHDACYPVILLLTGHLSPARGWVPPQMRFSVLPNHVVSLGKYD